MSTMTFEAYVAEWASLVSQIEETKKSLKPLEVRELEMRKSIAAAVGEALGDRLKEGVNNFPVGDRVLKLGYRVDRKIDTDAIGEARDAYNALNDRTVEFDALLRVKHELAKREFDKLTESQAKAVSRMIVSKPAAPTLEII